jgi:hypothetical protein
MSRLTKPFKITTWLISIIDIATLVYFVVSLTLALNQKTILNTAHLVILIIAIVLNVVYVVYIFSYLIIHKKK